jgi:putative oxidoreductase
MVLLKKAFGLESALARALDLLASPALLVARIYVGWIFLKSGILKISSWESTLDLFATEYQVPVLPPALAAYAGTAGEIVFPVLLMLGLWSRFAALGLSAVNALAVVSYYHVLGGEGFEAALGQHLLWAVILAALAIFGPGRFALDTWIGQRLRQR